MEERISSKYDPARIILHIPTDTVLCMAGCVQGLHGNIANLEALAIFWGFGNAFAVFAADDGSAGEFGVFQLLDVS